MKHSFQSAQDQARAKLLSVDGVTMDHIIAIDHEIAKLRAQVPEFSVSSLTAFLQSIGWSIQPFDHVILSCLKLESFAYGKQSFAVDAEEVKLIFICTDKGSESNQLRLLLHEMGHILLHHDLKQMSASEEAQANYFEFCCLLKHHSPVETSVAKRTASLLAVLALCILFASLFFYSWFALEKNNSFSLTPATSPREEMAKEIPSDPNTIVYIASAGQKFHKAGCMYIKDKSNVIELTLEEAQALKKEPCSKCFGDGSST